MRMTAPLAADHKALGLSRAPRADSPSGLQVPRQRETRPVGRSPRGAGRSGPGCGQVKGGGGPARIRAGGWKRSEELHYRPPKMIFNYNKYRWALNANVTTCSRNASNWKRSATKWNSGGTKCKKAHRHRRSRAHLNAGQANTAGAIGRPSHPP